MNNNKTYSVHKLPRIEGGNGYWLSRPVCESSGIKSLEAAIADAGSRIGCNGGLMVIYEGDDLVRLIHYNGFSGVWTVTDNAQEMRKHLRDKCWGMTLRGNLPRN